jgi:hypothetical protein
VAQQLSLLELLERPTLDALVKPDQVLIATTGSSSPSTQKTQDLSVSQRGLHRLLWPNAYPPLATVPQSRVAWW